MNSMDNSAEHTLSLSLIIGQETKDFLLSIVERGSAKNIPGAIGNLIALGRITQDMIDKGCTEFIFQNPKTKTSYKFTSLGLMVGRNPDVGECDTVKQ